MAAPGGAAVIRITRIVVGMFVVCAAAGCDSALEEPAPPQPASQSSPPFAAELVHDGHYRGAAAIGGADYSHHVEALFTADGEVQLHVGGPGAGNDVRSGAGVPPTALKPAEAALFVGNVSWTGAEGRGQGVVIGERCTVTSPGRFCGAPAPAELSASQTRGRISGELRVTTARGVDTWALDIG